MTNHPTITYIHKLQTRKVQPNHRWPGGMMDLRQLEFHPIPSLDSPDNNFEAVKLKTAEGLFHSAWLGCSRDFG